MSGVLKTNSCLDVAIKAARLAGKILLKAAGNDTGIKNKGATDLVTDADIMAQNIIIKTILKKFPKHSFLSEESPEIQGKSDYLWVIDPLDGTANHASGIPFFCTSICLSYKGEPIVGVVYDPLNNELFSAQKGKGAYLNKKRINVSAKTNINKSLIGADAGHVERSKAVQKMSRVIDYIRGFRLQGAQALSLSYVGAGRLEGYFSSNTTPWDSSAGCLIIKEAGGIITQTDGKKKELFSKTILVSNNNRIHSELLGRLK
jgi:myo-inositol-1(or 4)-monophosphatase